MKQKIYNHLEIIIILITIAISFLCSWLISQQISDSDIIIKTNQNYTALDIFLNNSEAALCILSGIVTLGLLSFIIMFLNLMNIGVYFLYTLKATTLWKALYLTIFHGTIELLGLFLVYYVVLNLSKIIFITRTVKIDKNILIKNIKFIVFAVFCLLIAAVIEVLIING
ncbi:stage II sporulation protein M [Streptococcus ferus]|uniref:stage II sporulation protein M n=1 Tax=Streptococcus ferus TaxID=1345 RepID=UPI0023542DA5|nr:stage II sporulation protein M [Streptococcus ferus]